MLSFEKKVAPMIESIYDTLTPIEKTIAKYFLGLIPENESLSAQEVSKRLFVSIPSLTRFLLNHYASSSLLAFLFDNHK